MFFFYKSTDVSFVIAYLNFNRLPF